MKLTKITTVLLVSAVALILLGTTAYAKDKPDKPEPGKAFRGGDGGWGDKKGPGAGPHGFQMGAGQNQFPMLNDKAFKEEMERHCKAVEKIMKKTEDLRKELREEIKELREEYFEKAQKGKKNQRPDGKKIGKFMKEMKELIDEFTEDNEKELKNIAGKLFDERINHMENVIKIMKKNKKEVVEAHYKKVLLQPLQARMRAIQQRRMGPSPRENSRPQPQWRGQRGQRKQGEKAAPMKRRDEEDSRPRWHGERGQRKQGDKPAPMRKEKEKEKEKD
ncbi:MAG: hypothetical protein ABIH04_11270 [Planctomycetota bacterium]